MCVESFLFGVVERLRTPVLCPGAFSATPSREKRAGRHAWEKAKMSIRGVTNFTCASRDKVANQSACMGSAKVINETAKEARV